MYVAFICETAPSFLEQVKEHPSSQLTEALLLHTRTFPGRRHWVSLLIDCSILPLSSRRLSYLHTSTLSTSLTMSFPFCQASLISSTPVSAYLLWISAFASLACFSLYVVSIPFVRKLGIFRSLIVLAFFLLIRPLAWPCLYGFSPPAELPR